MESFSFSQLGSWAIPRIAWIANFMVPIIAPDVDVFLENNSYKSVMFFFITII